MADEFRCESVEVEDAFEGHAHSDPRPLSPAPCPSLYDLYLEQQRRLACPGCGEEAFLG